MSEPSVSPGTYYATFAGLVVLTFATVGLSFIDLGWWHIVVGLLIGAAKAALVALFFMHLLHADRMVWVVAGAGLFWLVIMMGLTLSDFWTRHWASY
jgi:cytochrome c oxidase subunit IV